MVSDNVMTSKVLSAAPYTCEVVALDSSLSVDPHEVPHLGLEPYKSPSSPINARFASLSTNIVALVSAPPRVHNDRPLEIALVAAGLSLGVGVAGSMACWLSAHALLSVIVRDARGLRLLHCVPLSVRPSGGSWIARALIRPAAWADAVSVTVVSLSLAGRPLHYDSLPATLRVGYNHSPAPAGAVLAAAKAGDVPALQAALDAGGSTEEADEVCALETRDVDACYPRHHPFLTPPATPQHCRTAIYWAAYKGRLEALRMLLAAGSDLVNSARVSMLLAAGSAEGVLMPHALALAPEPLSNRGISKASGHVPAPPPHHPPQQSSETPLHVAAYYGYVPVIALLLATPGVDPLARDSMVWKCAEACELACQHTPALPCSSGVARHWFGLNSTDAPMRKPSSCCRQTHAWQSRLQPMLICSVRAGFLYRPPCRVRLSVQFGVSSDTFRKARCSRRDPECTLATSSTTTL